MEAPLPPERRVDDHQRRADGARQLDRATRLLDEVAAEHAPGDEQERSVHDVDGEPDLLWQNQVTGSFLLGKLPSLVFFQ